MFNSGMDFFLLFVAAELRIAGVNKRWHVNGRDFQPDTLNHITHCTGAATHPPGAPLPNECLWGTCVCVCVCVWERGVKTVPLHKASHSILLLPQSCKTFTLSGVIQCSDPRCCKALNGIYTNVSVKSRWCHKKSLLGLIRNDGICLHDASSFLSLSSGHDNIVSQQLTGNKRREDRDELQGSWWEAHHGQMGEGGGKGEAVTHDQSRHVAAHGIGQERRWRGRLHPTGQILQWCIDSFHAWTLILRCTYFQMKQYIHNNIRYLYIYIYIYSNLL